MAIQISGTTVINDSKELGTGLVSAYDTVTASGGGGSVTNRTVFCTNGENNVITLPASPSPGNEVVIINGGAYTGTIVARNGSNIMGLAENIQLDVKYVSVTLIYINPANGWRVC